MDNIKKLNTILDSFKINANCLNYFEYKNACCYDIELRPGTRFKELEKYSTELSLALKTYSKLRFNVVSNTGSIRLEYLKSKSDKISLFELAQTSPRPAGDLTCLLGETLDGKPLWLDLAKAPHLLVAGSSGSGKSTLLHSLIANVLLYPTASIFLMDPKSIEFFQYDDQKINRIHVDYDYQQCLASLEYLNEEMDRRYLMIKDYKISNKDLPFIVLIIDEFADLKMQDEDRRLHSLLCRLAQKSRAARIHLVLATQRPSVNVVDGTIKANFPARISCKVASHVDSKVILDASGAEDLAGAGDSLINNSEFDLQRFQAAFTDASEVCRLMANV